MTTRFHDEGSSGKIVGSYYVPRHPMGFDWKTHHVVFEKFLNSLRKNRLAVFFDFKEEEEYGYLEFAAVTVNSRWMQSITQIGFGCQATNSNITTSEVSKTISSLNEHKMKRPPFEKYYEEIHDILNEKILIGHGLLQSKWERFEAEFNHIGKKPPEPLCIIDTAVFARSKTKLARLSLLFGLGKASNNCLDNCRLNLDFITKCKTAMSIFEMMKARSGFYPTLCYLKGFCERRGSGVEEEDERRESKTDMEDVEPDAVFFDFQKDRFGMLHFAALKICTKTLRTYDQVKFFLHPDATAKLEKLKRRYDTIYGSLNRKTWIGPDVLKSDWPRLREECKYIGKPPPEPEKIVDIAYFMSSKTKLAELAVLVGMDKRPIPTFAGYINYIGAIKRCGYAMSILDMRVEPSVVHPMISHIMEFQPPPEATRTSESVEETSKIRRSERLKRKATRTSESVEETSKMRRTERLKRKSFEC